MFRTAVDGGPVATRQLLKCCENNGAAEVEKVAAAENVLAAEGGVWRQGRACSMQMATVWQLDPIRTEARGRSARNVWE